MFTINMKKNLKISLVVLGVATALAFWIYHRATDPMRQVQGMLGRDVVGWYFDTLCIRQSDTDTPRPERERNQREAERKLSLNLPAEVTLFSEETKFQYISHGELIFKYTANFAYPGRHHFVVLTETYFCDIEIFIPFPIKREIVDTKAKKKIAKGFVWDGAFAHYLKQHFRDRIVEQAPGGDR